MMIIAAEMREKKNRGQLHVCKGYMSKFVYGRHNKTVV